MSKKTSRKSKKALLAVAISLSVVGGLVYHSQNVHASSEVVQKSIPQPPIVEVSVLSRQAIRHWSTFSGTLSAIEQVDVKPRVSGAIVEVHFQDGEKVEKGQSLFTIDPRPYQSVLASAEAERLAAEADVVLSGKEMKRAEQLIAKRAISESSFDQVKNKLAVAKARLNLAEAQVKQATLDLEYTKIKAPVSGHLSRAEITLGNIVEAGPGAPTLATLVSDDSLYVEFNLDEQTYLRHYRQGKLENMPVKIIVNDQHTVSAKVHAFDNRLDRTSGTIRARAIFDNREEKLLPGMFVTLKLGADGTAPRLLVPERSIKTNQDKKVVYVVDTAEQIQVREVELEGRVAGNRIVKAGLIEGDRVLVNSLQRVFPGMEVHAQPVKSKTMTAINAY